MHFHYLLTFTGYIRCFRATTSHDHFDLDCWPLDLESVSCTALLMSDPHTNFYYHMTILLTELRVLNIWSHIRYLKQSLRMRRVTWPLTEGENSQHFWNPWPQFTFSLCHFQGATTKIKPCYRQKNSVFPLWRIQSLLRMRSITWPVHRWYDRRSPNTTRRPNNFLTSNCLFTIQLLCGYHDD